LARKEDKREKKDEEEGNRGNGKAKRHREEKNRAGPEDSKEVEKGSYGEKE